MPARATERDEQIQEGSSRAAPPAPAASQPEDVSAQRFMRLGVQQSTAVLALVEGARVVYLGSNRHKTQAWPQTILLKFLQVNGVRRMRKEISKVGLHTYSFVRYDEAGDLIRDRMMDAPDEPDIHGRPFVVCEHPEHLRHFLRATDATKAPEYEVLIPEPFHAYMEEYVRRKERFRTHVEHAYKDTGGTVARHSVLGVA